MMARTLQAIREVLPMPFTADVVAILKTIILSDRITAITSEIVDDFASGE